MCLDMSADLYNNFLVSSNRYVFVRLSLRLTIGDNLSMYLHNMQLLRTIENDATLYFYYIT